MLKMDYESNEEISSEDYLTDILMVSVRLGKIPTTTEYNELGAFHARSGRRKYGSWDNTISALGCFALDLTPTISLTSHLIENNETYYSNNEIHIRKHPFISVISPCYSIARWYNGSKKLFYKNEQREEPIKIEKMCSIVKDYEENCSSEYVDFNHAIKISNTYDEVSVNDFYRWFGCYKDALKISGIRNNWTTAGRSYVGKVKYLVRLADELVTGNAKLDRDEKRRGSRVARKITEKIPRN